MTMIAQRQAEADDAGAGFADTLPPPPGADAPLPRDAQAPPPSDMAYILFPLGMQGMHASVIEVESMACQSSWSIGDAGGRGMSAADPSGTSLAAVMATIVHLNKTPFDQTLTRQLDPQRWAFAWRVDEYHVAVAEARYRVPDVVRSENDTAVMRQLCSAGIQAGEFRHTEAVNDQSHRPAPDTPGVASAPQAAPRTAPARLVDRLAQRLRWPLLLAMALGGLVSLLAALQIESSRAGEARRLRNLGDATMAQHLAGVLATGDYGEVQAELDSFESQNRFKGAVVVDARRRAVASAGAVPALRIGQALAAPDVADARIMPLQAAAGSADGQLLIWGAEASAPRRGAAGQALWAVCLLLTLATLAGLALLWRRRRRDAAADQALSLPLL